jgi:hypothetical protein
VQFNDGGTLAGDTALTWNKTSDQLTVGGDINLDSGGNFSTTIQSVTPTANRTISFPDQTGTVGLVSGATGNIQYNNAGQLAGTGDFNVDLNWTDAGVTYTGLKVNVTDTASAADSNLVDIQSNGTSQVVVDDDGKVGIGTNAPGQQLTVATSTGNCYIEAKRASQDAGQVALQLTGGTSGTDWILYQPAVSNDLRIFGNSGDRVTVTSAGKVGIGTQSPYSRLDIGAGTMTIHAGLLDFRTNDNVTRNMYIASDATNGQIISYTPNLKISGNNILFENSSSGERARIDSSGRLLVGSDADSGGALLQVNGDRIRVATAKTPASATAAGTAGEICWDANYIYVCVATNSWKRTAIAAW